MTQPKKLRVIVDIEYDPEFNISEIEALIQEKMKSVGHEPIRVERIEVKRRKGFGSHEQPILKDITLKDYFRSRETARSKLSRKSVARKLVEMAEKGVEAYG